SVTKPGKRVRTDTATNHKKSGGRAVDDLRIFADSTGVSRGMAESREPRRETRTSPAVYPRSDDRTGNAARAFLSHSPAPIHDFVQRTRKSEAPSPQQSQSAQPRLRTPGAAPGADDIRCQFGVRPACGRPLLRCGNRRWSDHAPIGDPGRESARK